LKNFEKLGLGSEKIDETLLDLVVKAEAMFIFIELITCLALELMNKTSL
jgi:hypothetical protein